MGTDGAGPIIDVQTGEVKAASGDIQLVSNAVGSCIAVALYDPQARVGGIAHVMLPGRAASSDGRHHGTDSLRYASNAIEELLRQIEQAGGVKNRLRVCAAGGANVLERPDDTICEANIASVRATIAHLGLRLCAESLGGTKRRRVRLELGTGKLYCAEGDGPERVICECGDE